VFKLPRNPGRVGFRAYKVRETLPHPVHVHVALADKVKKMGLREVVWVNFAPKPG